MAFTMQCNVQNSTGVTLTDVSVSHVWTDNPSQQPDVLSQEPVTLAPGQTLSFSITSGSGGSDEWSVSITLNGVPFFRNDKQCDVEEEDAESGNPVTINFNPPPNFDVITPVSSPCLGNSLDS